MSVEDGDKINKVFVDKQKQIDSLKLHLDSVKYYHNQYMIFNGQRMTHAEAEKYHATFILKQKRK